MEAMADTIPNAAVGSKASELCKAMIRELLMGQSVEGYCGNCGVIRNAEVPSYEVSYFFLTFLPYDRCRHDMLTNEFRTLQSQSSSSREKKTKVRRLKDVKGCLDNYPGKRRNLLF